MIRTYSKNRFNHLFRMHIQELSNLSWRHILRYSYFKSLFLFVLRNPFFPWPWSPFELSRISSSDLPSAHDKTGQLVTEDRRLWYTPYGPFKLLLNIQIRQIRNICVSYCSYFDEIRVPFCYKRLFTSRVGVS